MIILIVAANNIEINYNYNLSNIWTWLTMRDRLTST